MKVRISFTLDIDPVAWESDYGISGAKEIREDVQLDVEGSVTENLRSMGLLVEKPVNLTGPTLLDQERGWQPREDWIV